MKIPAINTRYTSFKQRIDDEYVLGYDDEISQKYRDHIREHISSYAMPYQSIYETSGRKSEREMDDMLKSWGVKVRVVDCEKIYDLPVNVLMITDNACRGRSLANQPDSLKDLKNSGIEQVIDLVGFSGYEESCKKAGLKYLYFNMGDMYGDYIWDNEAFTDKKHYVQKNRYYSTEEPINSLELTNILGKEYDLKVREFVDELVNLVQVAQKGYYYIGCEFGTYKTDDALALIIALNPQQADETLYISDLFKIDGMRNLYKNLTSEDKKKMGWTKEFDENFLPRLQEVEERNASNEDLMNRMGTLEKLAEFFE